MIRPSLAGAMALCLLAGCSGSGRNETNLSAEPEAPVIDVNVTEAPSANEFGETPGDETRIVLVPLTASDLQSVDLEGELACSFDTEAGKPPLLLARGDVASAKRSQGAFKLGDSVTQVSAAGGFDGMTGGATFSGDDVVIRIALTGESRGGGESPPRPATLSFEREDGASRKIDGFWTCGP